LLDQIPHARIAKPFNNAQNAMQSGQWRQAIPHLDNVLKIAPDRLDALYYKAICYAKLEEWKTAERVAKQGLEKAQSPSERQIRQELQELINQISTAKVMVPFNKANEAMKKAQWLDALPYLDEVIELEPSNCEARFYRALCYFRMDDGFPDNMAKAKQEALNAQKYCTDRNIKDQLQQIITIASRPTWVGEIIQYLNTDNFNIAQDKLNNILRREPYSGIAYYYRAICSYKMALATIPRNGKIDSYQRNNLLTAFKQAYSDVEQAASYSIDDPQARAELPQLKTLINQYLTQLQ
jgi:Tfp pilus assembly protein PilF